MPDFLALTFELPLDSEEILKGYFLMNYDVQGFEETQQGKLIVYIPSDSWDETELQNFLTLQKDIKFLSSEKIENKDWNAAWEATIEPVRISEELVVTPSWKIEDAKKLNAQHLLIIDPKMSFGTGHHETTRLCLQLIEELYCNGKSILDIGTGTGALAMYALMRGAKYAIGIDTDEWSYRNAIENRKQNTISEDRFEIRYGDLESTIKSNEIFDIIFANIHRNILLQINERIARHHKNGGELILSGILQYDTEEIISVYEKTGYILIRKMQENEWIALYFRQQP